MDDFFSLANSFDEVKLEIGFGKGEHLASLANTFPRTLFIGCEPLENGVSALLKKIVDDHLDNIRIFPDDSRKLLPKIPDLFLDAVFILFPDPWRKRKHNKRRFFQEDNVLELHRAMKKHSELRIATDHKDYFFHMKKVLSQQDINHLFDSILYTESNRPDITNWPVTNYERKANDPIVYMKLIKL
jgi:tRNA (guanine-N7-)-methyltransferase